LSANVLAIKKAYPGRLGTISHSANFRNAHNFSGGPGALPQCVLDDLAAAVQEVPEVGLSILGISHRTDWFRGIVQEAECHIRSLVGLDDHWHVLFLQGGSSLQFSMIPMNLGCQKDTPVSWLQTGYWSLKAATEASAACRVRTVWDGAPTRYTTLPHWDAIQIESDAAFLHYVSNETAEGLQFDIPPPQMAYPVVCDMSSDFLARPVDVNRFDLIYAHAQKNLGPAGVTIVLLRDHLVDRIPRGLPPMLDYRTHIRAGSIYNTPPVLAIYTLVLTLRWMRAAIGSLQTMWEINQAKARVLYDAIDHSRGVFIGHASPEHRSAMNIAFRLRDPEQHDRFLAVAEKNGFSGLAGHRSLGGMRASLYNGMGIEAVKDLATFISEYRHA